ncbi:MAG: hypothetical protein ACRD4B_08705, partial [Acidobacteriota bacterium]
MEWPPIKQENYIPDRVTERGYRFTLPFAATVVSGAYSVAEVPQSYSNIHTDPIAIYRAGDEDATGPVRKVIIPVSGVTISGAATGTVED